jgi:uncharacterized protein (DUF1330 family)
MPAYMVIRIDVDDPGLLKEYQMAAPPVIEQYGGRFLARGGRVATLEGPEESRRVVIVEFPDLADAEACYHSPEYTQARKLREGLAVAEFIAVEGVE